jgi:hypothetical protein
MDHVPDRDLCDGAADGDPGRSADSQAGGFGEVGTMTPLHIQLLLHFYAIAEPYAKHDPQHAESSAVRDYTENLVMMGLIYPDRISPSGYRATECGEAFIKRLLATPIAL